ncbi:DUF2993 domain-containing protein [Streptomyces sp. WAC05374]|uniref:LmeA family phospholipid-binding protein n=1 Tax=Streptomyces sp. WAC05374 TaxID=2487420 RepID=UPI000F88FA29|nr:DUF2993 domain-containing protein [Streptomyces sp. WAC05374]RST17224.1 DUF2993 domain-containing protein [Streptomyces sp. WAC05374]TDF47356.1 DUF2993 domain-containing protein [Streptomyces sp. WAC05374]TDF57614.1 DUF2993 domain-containing protein [Streptomyces sp. WAC05374]TDF61719.1 DUF2993 domain-containing protein [Streptomyces sp. WAC05374]
MRALRILLVTAVILGGLFTIADRLAVNYAESEAAERIRANQGLAGTPDVSIKGFPFLTQVMGKELEQVDVTLTGVEASAGGRKVRVAEMTAALKDVRLENNFSTAVAASASGTARISYADLAQASREEVTLGYGGNGKVKVTGSVEVPVLGKVTRSVLSSVSLVGGDTIRVRADKVPGEGIPGLEERIRERTDFDRQVGGLPAGLKLSKVEATPEGLAITVTGTNVVLAG